MIVFTDLDGTLLDGTSYSFDAAREAMAELRAHEIPLVLVSSKTRAEIEPIRLQLQNDHPFIVENGGGIFIPKGYFDGPVEGATVRGEYEVVELGIPYARLRASLKEIQHALGIPLRGLGDMTELEIAQRTGLSKAEAVLAKQREYDEPFIIDGPLFQIEDVRRESAEHGLRCTSGGLFHHLTGEHDKGQACRLLIDCYRHRSTAMGERVITVAVGDSANDLSMLLAVDRPILVQKPNGSYDPEVRVPNIILAPSTGPVGWNKAVLEILAGL
ncbi:MAG: mannosyl-3-phosphoglycerate phosphatase [Nitrospira sp.]|nr:MAG: mannosyl-3-phosphoglycerate phosphatase [Nitrospira sp.]